MTPERKAQLIEEAEYLAGSTGHNLLLRTSEESVFFWDYVYEVLGIDSCNSCVYYVDEGNLDRDGYCEDCHEAEYD